MCNICGCGETKIDGNEAVHSHGHDHDHHPMTHQPPTEASRIVHHHYYHQGDVHHHVHYPLPSEQETAVSHVSQPEISPNGDLHYGKGEAGVHVAGVDQHQLLQLEQDILGNNNHIAEHNRAHFMENKHLVLNLVSSPGSGKTTLLTQTLTTIKNDIQCAVIEGDQQTSHDADRIRATQVPAIQVNTGKGCHLDADMIHQAYHDLALSPSGIIFIENVGNLVCPASFDLGEKGKVAILSVTEGEDKPLKYPNMFAAAELMIINKIDLLPYVNFNVESCIAYARRVNPDIQVFTVSATTGEGMEAWISWLNENYQSLSS